CLLFGPEWGGGLWPRVERRRFGRRGTRGKPTTPHLLPLPPRPGGAEEPPAPPPPAHRHDFARADCICSVCAQIRDDTNDPNTRNSKKNFLSPTKDLRALVPAYRMSLCAQTATSAHR